MHRIVATPFLAVTLLPAALILLTFGIDKLAVRGKKGLWLKTALLVNSSLILALNVLGCCCGDNRGGVSCYEVAISDVTEIPDEFETSPAWNELESGLWSLEQEIRSGQFDYDRADELLGAMNKSIDNLTADGLITRDDSAVLKVYVTSRHEYYCCSVGNVLCYEGTGTPTPKEMTPDEIVNTVGALRGLYEGGKVDGEAYRVTPEKLESQLTTYTNKKDNAVLRQLLLDLADGRTGGY